MTDIDVFKDLEHLLFRGFLTAPIVLKYGKSKIPILLKSLTEYEFDFIQENYFWVEDVSDKYNYYLAYSILSIDGENILPYRDHDLIHELLLPQIKSWPEEYFEQIATILDLFRQKMQVASKLLEMYSYTDLSRAKWAMYKNQLLNNSAITGWKGTESIPLSSLHISWFALNNQEDARLDYDKFNDVARYVSTAFNPKGMQQVNDKETRRRDALLKRREILLSGEKESLLDDISEYGFIDHTKLTDKGLEQLFQRMNKGELDAHEYVMQEYNKNIKKLFIEEKKKKEALLTTSVSNPDIQNTLPSVSSSSRVMTQEELLEFVKNPKPIEPTNNSDIQPLQGIINTDYVESFLSPDIKSINRLGPGGLTEEEEQYLRKDLLAKPRAENKKVIRSASFEQLKDQQDI